MIITTKKGILTKASLALLVEARGALSARRHDVEGAPSALVETGGLDDKLLETALSNRVRVHSDSLYGEARAEIGLRLAGSEARANRVGEVRDDEARV
jgi:hypothetical protein